MRSADQSLPAQGERVMTACGGVVEFAADTPSVRYQDSWLFFCLPDCRARFERNPAESCLAENLPSQTRQNRT